MYPPKVFSHKLSISQNRYGIKPWIISTPKVIANIIINDFFIFLLDLISSDFEKALDAAKLEKYRVMQMKNEGVKLLDLIVAKCRDGETNYRHYWYNGPRLHFEEIVY